MQTLAAVCRAANAPVRIETLQLDAPRADEVVVRVVAAGVCHTDLFAPLRFPLPAVFGHEGAGIIEKVGAAVTRVRRGDRVAMTFGSCGRCQNCLTEQMAACEVGHHLQFSGEREDGSTTLRDASGATVHGAFFQQSSFATYALATERNVTKLPDAMPLELAGPLGCGIQTGAGAVLNTLSAQPGTNIAIFGVGSVGLAAVMGAKLAGCDRIVAIDINPERLALAREFGATHTLDAREGEVVARLHGIVPRGMDYSFENAGQVQTFNDAIECLARKGSCAIATVPLMAAPFPYSPFPLLTGGKKLIGCLEGDSVPDRFIPLLAEHYLAGRLPIDRLVTYYDFADIAMALDDAHTQRAIKPILRMA
jgi:aryl-alcohol dehydrogenase